MNAQTNVNTNLNLEEAVSAIAATMTAAEAVKLIAKLTPKLKQLKAVIENAEDVVKAYMGDNEKLEIAGHIVTYTNYTSNRLDTASLKAEQPEIYNSYIKESECRRFAVK